MESSSYPGMQINENLPLQQREWRITRIVWFFLYALLLAIALGLLGQGPLAKAELRGADGRVEMEYRRFATAKSGTPLKLHVPPVQGRARVLLSQAYVDDVEILRIVPPPEKVVAEKHGLAFVFNAGAADPVPVTFFVEPQRPGRLEGWYVFAADAVGLRRRFSQFVYP